MNFFATAVIAALAVAPSSAFVNQRSFGMTRLQITESVSLGAIKDSESKDAMESLTKFALASLVSISLIANPMPASADGATEKFRLPPIDFSDETRCVLNSSKLGQANAARDKLYDLRQCQISGAAAPGFDLSGVLMSKTDASKSNFQEAYFSKGYMQGTYRFTFQPTPRSCRFEY
jgi:uncharacterized protein YjbI with pentapeptide repeats